MENHCFDDIAFEVLTWLPGKSLLRFKCISKAWNTLIQQPNFMKLHNARSHARPTHVLFQLGVCAEWEKDFATNEKKQRLEGFPLELVAPRHYFYHKKMYICSNHCNGLICLYSFKDTLVYLYSVTTREIKALPPFVNHGKWRFGPMLFLGFDLITEKYKLIHNFSENNNNQPKTRILTLGTHSSWRTINRPSKCSLMPWSCIFLKGVLYSTNIPSNCVSYFNFTEEKFGTISAPQYCNFSDLNRVQTALSGKLVMQCCFNHNGTRDDSDCIYDELNKVFTKLNYPTNSEKEMFAFLEAEKIDKPERAHVLVTTSIINTPASLVFPPGIFLKHVSSFVENIIPLSSSV